MGTRANTQATGLGLLRAARVLLAVSLGLTSAGQALCEHAHSIPPEDDNDIDPNDPHDDKIVLTKEGLLEVMNDCYKHGVKEAREEMARRGWRAPVAQLADDHPLAQGRLVGENTDDDATPPQGLVKTPKWEN